MKLRAELAGKQQAIAHREQALQIIEQDQERLRANMERVPRDSHAYQRYLKKFDDQETQIENRRRVTVSQLRERAQQQRQGYEQFLLNLNVE